MKNLQFKYSILMIWAFFFCVQGFSQHHMVVANNIKVNVSPDIYLVEPGNLTMNSGSAFNLSGMLTIDGTFTNNAGTSAFTLTSTSSNTGSLIEGTGISATIQRFISQDVYHYLSSPVEAQAMSILQTGTAHTDFDLFWFDEDNSSGQGPLWIDAAAQGGNMEVGLGYSYTYNTSDRTIEYTGTTNTGTITEPLTYTYDANISTNPWYFGWNIIGNPYPSRLDAEAFIDDSENSDIYGTLYFWAEAPGFSGLEDDYGTWNKTGSVAGGTGPAPNGNIDLGQAFMVHTTEVSGSVKFKDGMRVHNAANFYKTPAQRFKLSVSNSEGNYNEILIGFVQGASNKADNKYDGYKLKGNASLALYTKLVEDDSFDYAIQALPPLTDGATVKVGMDIANPDFCTLKVVSIENFNDTTSILLEDLAENVVVNLRETPEYHFAVNNSGSVVDRFLLHFNTSAVGMEELGLNEQPLVYVSNGQIIIKTLNDSQSPSIAVFDILGRNVSFTLTEDDKQFMVNPACKYGVYIIRISFGDSFYSEKVYLK